MRVKDLIKLLQSIDKDSKVYVACDEEWNTIFGDIAVELDNNNIPVIFGISGSEVNNE